MMPTVIQEAQPISRKRQRRSASFRWLIDILGKDSTIEHATIEAWQSMLADLRIMTAKGMPWSQWEFALAARAYVQRRVRAMKRSA